MNKRIMTVCSGLFLVMTMVLAFLCYGTEQKQQGERENVRTYHITEWTRQCDGEKDENGNYTIVYTIRVPEMRKSVETIMFYSYHSNVSVYVDGKIIYQSYLDKGDKKGLLVYASSWNRFALTKEYEGQEMEIVLKTPYQSVTNYYLEINMGDEMCMVVEEMVSNLPSICISIIVLICGFCMCASSIISKNRSTNSYSVNYLGVFSIMIGIWSVLDLPIVQFVIGDSVFLQHFIYLLFGVVTVPCIFFESQIIAPRFRNVLYGLIAVIMTVPMLCLGLQILGLFDMKESLILVHIVLMLFIIIFVVLTVLSIKSELDGAKEKLNRVNLVFAIITAVAVGIDIVIYYLSIREEYYCFLTKLSLLMYIITLACFTIREAGELVQKGKEAGKFETMAYRDELTGVYSRMAYQEYVRTTEISDKKYIVVMFDLNNLKRCNDTWGHQVGDLYIKISADFIQETFSELGDCYRIGGDEFCVVSKDWDESKIRDAIQKLEGKVKEENQKYPKLNMEIAVGYSMFDQEIDQNLEDTRNRADSLMYQDKREKKQNINNIKKNKTKAK